MEVLTTQYNKEVKVSIEAFKGMQSREGEYGSLSSEHLSSGKVTFIADLSVSENYLVDAVNWFIIESEDLIDVALKSILPKYLKDRILAAESMNNEDAATLLPVVTSHLELKPLCGVVAIYIHEKSNNGMLNFGIEFGCNWDDEHGLGCLFEGKTVTSIGYADEAF